MKYKTAYKKIEKLLTNLQVSLDHEEWQAVMEDRSCLLDSLEAAKKKLPIKIESLEDKLIEPEYNKLLGEVYFYLDLASSDLQNKINTFNR